MGDVLHQAYITSTNPQLHPSFKHIVRCKIPAESNPSFLHTNRFFRFNPFFASVKHLEPFSNFQAAVPCFEDLSQVWTLALGPCRYCAMSSASAILQVSRLLFLTWLSSLAQVEAVSGNQRT